MENSASKAAAPVETSGNLKREKFVNLAENRTANAIKAIRIIGKLGNKTAYDFTDADVKKITGALIREVEALRTRLGTTGAKEVVDFKL
jgi:ribosomal protein L7/L12